MNPEKPFAESCVQNREPIKRILEKYLEGRTQILEIGSGTGQHAVYFSQAFPQLIWQTSDLQENHAGINAWVEDSGLDNIRPPLLLDSRGSWPNQQYDLLFSANTVHIMSVEMVEQLFIRLPDCMHERSVFLVYGPFNYQGRYTSDSNARFDQWLKQRNAESGIKNFEWLQAIAAQSGLECVADHEMPANNRTLVWQKMQPQSSGNET